MACCLPQGSAGYSRRSPRTRNGRTRAKHVKIGYARWKELPEARELFWPNVRFQEQHRRLIGHPREFLFKCHFSQPKSASSPLNRAARHALGLPFGSWRPFFNEIFTYLPGLAHQLGLCFAIEAAGQGRCPQPFASELLPWWLRLDPTFLSPPRLAVFAIRPHESQVHLVHHFTERMTRGASRGKASSVRGQSEKTHLHEVSPLAYERSKAWNNLSGGSECALVR